MIISGIPRRMTSDKCFNKESVNLIINLAYLYKIDNLKNEMTESTSLVLANMNKLLDADAFYSYCRCSPWCCAG